LFWKLFIIQLLIFKLFSTKISGVPKFQDFIFLLYFIEFGLIFFFWIENFVRDLSFFLQSPHRVHVGACNIVIVFDIEQVIWVEWLGYKNLLKNVSFQFHD